MPIKEWLAYKQEYIKRFMLSGFEADQLGMCQRNETILRERERRKLSHNPALL